MPWPPRGAKRRLLWGARVRYEHALATFLASATSSVAAAGECTQPSNPIETDRPDTTNSSIVLPVGSFQSENGINVSRQDGGRVLDSTNSRLRLGVAPCFEVLVDLPTVDTPIRGAGVSGFTDVAPAVKWQISPIPEKFELSITAGVGLPIGAVSIAGPCTQPYPTVPVVGGAWTRLGHYGHGDQFLHAGGPSEPVH
jgi:hypothetical protein